MEKIVTVEVPQNEAIKRGKANWGSLRIDFEEVLNLLSPEERNFLCVSDSGELKVLDKSANGAYPEKIAAGSPAAQSVVIGIKDAIANIQSKKDKKVEEAQKELNKILKCPEECFNPATLKKTWSFKENKISTLVRITKTDSKPYEDAMNKAFEKLKASWTLAVLDALKSNDLNDLPKIDGQTVYRSQMKETANACEIKQVQEILNEYEKQERIHKEEQEKLKEKSANVWKQWAIENGSEDLKLAIKDDYPLGQRVEEEMFEYLFPKETNFCEIIEYTKKDEERRVPNKKARALKAHLEQEVANKHLPEGTTMTVSRILSIEAYFDHGCEDPMYCDECDSDGEVILKKTAVAVEVKAPHTQKTKYYIAKE